MIIKKAISAAINPTTDNHIRMIQLRTGLKSKAEVIDAMSVFLSSLEKTSGNQKTDTYINGNYQTAVSQVKRDRNKKIDHDTEINLIETN